MEDEVIARAFWLRAPGAGEIRPVRLPEPGPDDVLVRTLRSGISRGTETLVFRGGVPPASTPDAGAVPGRRLPRPGQVRLPERRRRGAGPGRAARAHRVLPVPAPDRVRRAGRGRDRRAGRRAARAGRARRHGRDRGQRAVGRRAAGRRPGRRGRRRHGRLLRRPAARPVPRRRGHARGRRPGRAAVAAALGVDFALPDDAAGGRDLVVHASATSAGLQRSLDLLAPEGTVLDLSWYGDAEVRLSLGGAFHASRLGIRSSQVGTRLPGPQRAPHDGRPARARARPAARPRVRRARHRRVALRRAARRDGPAGRRHPAGALPHDHLRRGSSPCSA